MHQTIIAHLDSDTDWDNAMTQKPFYHWLASNPYTTFHTAMRYYLGDGARDTMRGQFSSDQIDVYKHTFSHFWYRRLRKLDR